MEERCVATGENPHCPGKEKHRENDKQVTLDKTTRGAEETVPEAFMEKRRRRVSVAIRRNAEKSGEALWEVGDGHSVRRTAHSSGGLKSLWRSIEGRHIQESGGNSSLAVLADGGQGVCREVESEGFEEKYRAVINGSHPDDEPVGPRWDKVEPAIRRRRRSQSPIEPRCLRAARYGRTVSDSGRTHAVPEWHRDKQAYKLKAKWNVKPDEWSDNRIVPEAWQETMRPEKAAE